MTDERKDLPPVNSPNFLEKVREALGVYLGNRGNGLDRGLTLRDLTEAGIVQLRKNFGGSGGTRNPIGGLGSLILDASEYVVDLTPPPTPTGFAATSAISNIMVECGPPTYPQGHGHSRSKLYGATWSFGPRPVFSDAKLLTEFQGTVAAHATNPATTWHLWLTWVTVDGVESITPAGGINGLVTRTGEDVALLLKAMAGAITESELYGTLNSRIDLIDGPALLDGSVSARVAAQALAQANALAVESDARILAVQAETDARNLALGAEVQDRANAVANEARLRVDAVGNEARARLSLAQESAQALLRNVLSINATALAAEASVAVARRELSTDIQDGLLAEATERLTLLAKLDTDMGATLAVVAEESIARATADGAEATQRGLLAAQVLGADGTALTQGLIYNERYTRAQENQALAQQMTLLSAGAGEQFDPADIWYFDTGVENWTGNAAPTATAGWLRPANQTSGAFVASPSDIAADGAKYNQVRLRVRKTGAPVFAGYLYWRAATDAAWDVSRRVVLEEPTWDVHGIGLVTVTPGWTGTIGTLRVDLSDAQTATDYLELDWVAIGRPSPGASSAQLMELERVTVDPSNSTSLAAKYLALNAQVNDPTGLAAAVSTIASEYLVQADLDSSAASAQQTLLSQFGATSKTWVSATRPGFSGGAQTNPNITVVLANGASAARATYKNGDLWIDTANGNALYAWLNGAWVAATDASVLGTAAFINAWESTFANGTGSGAQALRVLSTAYAEGNIATASGISDLRATFSDALKSLARDTKTLQSQSAELDGLVLTNILNGEAARDAFAGEMALAREELQTNIVTGLSAEASKRLELVAVVNTNAAALTQEQTTRATQTEALSQDLTILTSTVGTNQAEVYNNFYTKTTADAARAQSQKTLVANFGASTVFRQDEPPTQGTTAITLSNGELADRVKIRTGDLWFDTNDGNKPYLWSGSAWVYSPNTSAAASQAYLNELETALATSSLATVTAWRDMVARVVDPVTGLEATRSDLHTEQETRATAEGTTARDFKVLKSQSEELSELQLTSLLNGEAARGAFIGEVALAREELQTNIATGLSAEAFKRLELLAVVNGNAGLLTQEQLTRATQTEALSRSVQTLGSTVDANQSLLVNSYRTAANQDTATAQALTQLQSTVGSNLAQALTSYYTGATTDAAIAQSKSQLRAYADASASRTFRQDEAPLRRGTSEGASIPLQVGDMWFDTNDKNRPYLCTLADGISVRWDASDTTFAQPEPPVTAVLGAMWIDTNDKNKLHRWDGLNWVAYRDEKLTEVLASVDTIETSKIGFSTVGSAVSAGGKLFDAGGTIGDRAAMLAWNAAHPTETALVWNVGLPLAQAVKQVSVTVNGVTGTIEDRMVAVAQTANSIYLEKAVRLGDDDSVVGYGLSATVDATTGAVTKRFGDSKFIVNVDKFAISTPKSSIPLRGQNLDGSVKTVYALGDVARLAADDTKTLVCVQPGTQGGAGLDISQAIGKVLTDGEVKWQIASRIPFSVAALPFTYDGVNVPAGALMDGAYIRDATITSAKIGDLRADKITAGTITASVELTAAKISSGLIQCTQPVTVNGVTYDHSYKLETNGLATFNNAVVRGTVYATDGKFSGEVIATGAGGEAGDMARMYYGNFEVYRTVPGVGQVLYKALSRSESGVGDNNVRVTIPGYFKNQPKVIVSPASLQLYATAYANQNQSITVEARSITESTSGSMVWSFLPVATLNLAANTGSAVINQVSGTVSGAWTSSQYTTPANATSISPSVTLASNRGNGASQYFYRTVRWKVQYYNGSSWVDGAYTTVALGADTNASTVSTGSFTFPSSGTWVFRIYAEAYDTNGTVFGAAAYNYATYTSSSATGMTADTQTLAYQTGGTVTKTYTLSNPVPGGWTAVSGTMSYTYSGWVSKVGLADGSVSAPSFYKMAATSYESFSGTKSFSTTSSSFNFRASRDSILGNTGNGVITVSNVSHSVYAQQPVTNSTTAANNFQFNSYGYSLTSAQVLATGSLNWAAIGG